MGIRKHTKWGRCIVLKGTSELETNESEKCDKKCNAPSGALGSPTWTRGVTQGNSEGTGFNGGPSVQDSGEGSEVKEEV
jgi:hypothetical protein